MLLGLFAFALPGMAQTITGTVFRDFNSNGVQDSPATGVGSGETGVPGVVVTAYPVSGSPKSATTNAAGIYSIAGLTGSVRVEFTNLTTGDFDSFKGTGSGTSVQFTSAGGTVNFGLNYPAHFCQPNPGLATPCYINGDPLATGSTAGASDVLVQFPYNSTGNVPANTHLATGKEVGAVWGLAYQRSPKRLFTAALVKRHAGLGPLGPGGIYVTNYSTGSPVVSQFIDVVADLGVNVGSVPSNTTRQLPADQLASNNDPLVYDLVGKAGLGDLDISDDGKTLYFVNLFDKKLYSLLLDADNNPATKPARSDLSSVTIPNPCTGGAARPFGLKYYRGDIYAGVICDAETSQKDTDLKATVYRLTGGSFTKVIEFPLTFERGAASQSCPEERYWHPWSATLPATCATGVVIYMQPMLSDLEFDTDGSLLIGFMDRLGHQTGSYNKGPDPNDQTLYNVRVGGDILRAAPKADGTFLLENNGSSGGITTAGASTSQGPGGGEYYFGDRYFNGSGALRHEENLVGGLALLPGSGEVVSTAFDPVNGDNNFSGGVIFLGNASGDKADAYEVFAELRPATFGKAIGLGDLELLCNPAPIQIGNRVWTDANNNGVQDPGETPLAGVTVTLKGPGLVSAGVSVTTNSAGEYYFSNATGSNATGFAYSLTGLAGNGAYTLSFPASFSTLSLSTKPNAATGTNADAIDSDPNASGVISFTLGQAGQNNFNYDAGYTNAPVCAITTTAFSGTCTPATNQYTVTGSIGLTATAGGTATITDGAKSTTVAVAAAATSVAYSLTGLTSNGASHTVTVSLPGCGSATATYTAPVACSVAAGCVITLKPTLSGCYSVAGVSKATVSIEVIWSGIADNTPITVRSGNQTRTITPLMNATSSNADVRSPQVVAFEIPANGAVGSVSAVAGSGATACTAVAPFTAPAACPPLACTSLGGTVFEDFDADGVRDAGEGSGLAGVVIIATDVNGQTYTTTSDGGGNFILSIPAGAYPVRIEFGTLATAYNGTPTGTSGRSSVQFIAAPTCNVFMGVLNANDYCQKAPMVMLPCYVNGNPLATGAASANSDALVGFAYTLRGNQDMTKMFHFANAKQVGALWGTAYSRYTKKLYSSALLRRHVGLGPQGLGGIYITDASSPTPTTASTGNYVDVATLGIPVGSIATNSARGLPVSPLDGPSHDPDAFTAVGKAGLGDMDISEDGSLLWFTNLNDGKLYSLQIPASGAPASTDWTAHPLPNDNMCSSGVRRIWGTKVYKGKIYIGAVCDASVSKNKSDLRAMVYAYTPGSGARGAGGTYQVIFDFPLTYPKGFPNISQTDIRGWFPWEDSFANMNQFNSSGDTFVIHPQPILSDIEFDIDGSMVLGFADRAGLQLGYKNYSPVASDTKLYINVAGGDLLRALNSNGAFVLENAGKAGPNTGSSTNNNEGPGSGEFYNDDFYYFGFKIHTENANGGLALLPGSGEVVTTTMDPLDGQIYSGGVRYLSNTTGSYASGTNAGSAYVVYKTENNNGTLGKAVGLGDVELACNLPTFLEIGNRVWLDEDKDGIQDPDEKPLAGVQVSLYQGTTRITSTTTTATGEYYINNNPTSSTVAGTVSTTLLLPNANYTLRFGTNGTTSQYNGTTGLLTLGGVSYSLTQAFSTAPTANTLNDSNAQLTGGFASAPVKTGPGGSVDHTFDAGFICLPTTVASVSVTPATCPASGTIANNDGRIALTGIVNADKAFLITTSTVPSYTATGSQPVSASAVTFTGLTNPTSSAGQSYSVVLYSGPCCYTIVSALLPRQTCLPCQTSLTAAPGACVPATNKYVVTGTVSFTGTPGGTLTITDKIASFSATVTTTVAVSAGQASVPFSLTGLTSGGRSHTITASFSNAACGPQSMTYLSPVSCNAAPCVGTNLLLNPSFEQGFPATPNGQQTQVPPPSWIGGTADNNPSGFAAAEGYAYGFSGDNGTLCQSVTATPGSSYSLTFYGGVHQVNGQTVTLSFLNSSSAVVGSPSVFSQVHILESDNTLAGPYSLSGVAPAGTAALKVCAVSGNGTGYLYWSKIDNLCLTGTPAICKVAVGPVSTSCNPATNQYTATGTVSLTNATAQSLTITDGAATQTVSVSAGQTSASFSLTGTSLLSNQSSHTLTVTSISCGTSFTTYAAPASCSVVLSVAVTTPVCNTTTNNYTATATVSLTNAVAGTLTLTDNGATVGTTSVTAGQTSAAFTLTGVSGSSPAGHSAIATLVNGVTVTASTTYATPASCTVCSLSITTGSLPAGQVNTAYSQAIQTTGGATSLSFTVSAGSLPAGLTLTPATGLISGTPTSATTTSFTVKVTDSKSCSATVPLTITTSAAPVCSLTATANPTICNTATNQYAVTGTVSATNSPANQSLTISVGTSSTTVTMTGNGPVSYTLAGLTSDGLVRTVTVMSSATACGMTSVTYSAPASCTVGLQVVVTTPVCNTLTNLYTATATVSLTNAPAGTLTLTDNGNAVGTVSITTGQTTASFALTGVSGSSPASHSVVATLSGTTATASTSYATPASCTVCSLSVTTAMLANGQVGTAYSQTLVTTGGTAPLNFALTDGSLPTGLALNLTTGVISGTPVSAATTSFTVQVTDGKNCSTLVPLTITTSALPVCSLTATANPTICNTATNQYAVTGSISATNTTASQSLTISVGTSSTTVTMTGNGPVSYTLADLTSDGMVKTVTVMSSATACGMTSLTYTAPASCSIAPPSLTVVVSTPVCNTTTNNYTATVTVSLTNATAGTLTLTDNGTTVGTTSVAAGQTTASFTLTGVSGSTPASHPVLGSLTTGTITATASTSYATPASCTVCSLSLVTASLANAQVNAPYTQVLVTTGGTAPLSFSVVGGSLPPGLSLDPATGQISGTPTSATTTTVTITIIDGKRCALSRVSFTVSVNNEPVCALTATATPTLCSTATNQYAVTGTVSATNSPATQSLTVAVGGVSSVVTLSGNGPVSYTLAGLDSDGLTKTVTVLSSATACGMTSVTYAAPLSCTVAPPKPTYTLTKFVNKSLAKIGDILSYTVIVTNTSTVAAANLTITDVLDSGLAYTGSTPSSGTFTSLSASPGSATTGTWTIPALAPAGSSSLVLTATILEAGIRYNVATLDSLSARVCTSVPYVVCKGSDYSFRLTVAAGRNNYQWYKDGQPIANATTNTLDVTTAGSYSLVVDQNAGQCTDFSCCPFIVTESEVRSFSAVTVAATCVATTPQANAGIGLTNVASQSLTAYTYQLSPGTSFSAATALAAAAPVPANGVLAGNLPAPAQSQSYTVRLTDPLTGCFLDQVVVLLPTVCDCPAPVCVPVTIKKTRSRGVATR